MIIKTYSELIKLKSFKDRYNYLKIKGVVGESTFGFDRYFNQKFYKSLEWKRTRNNIIVRDNGCDLGIEDSEINGSIFIHHMNPISIDDIKDATEYLTNPEYLICTSFITHTAIHYGDEHLLPEPIIERSRHDTTPWKQ